MSEKKNKISNESLKNALCYAPFWAIIIMFTENKKSDKMKQNIKYWNIIFWIYILLNTFSFWLWWFVFVIYAWVSIFFWLKAYNWDEVKIEYIDDIEWKIKNKM